MPGVILSAILLKDLATINIAVIWVQQRLTKLLALAWETTDTEDVFVAC